MGLLPEDPVHDHSAGLENRPDLLAVDQLSHRRAAVPDELGNFIDRCPVVRQQRDEAVP
jgi:hypothetical protein